MNNAAIILRDAGEGETIVASRIAGVRNGVDGMKSTQFVVRWWHSGGSRIGADARGRVIAIKNILHRPFRTPLAQT